MTALWIATAVATVITCVAVFPTTVRAAAPTDFQLLAANSSIGETKPNVWLRFGESSGSTAYDSSGNRIEALCQGDKVTLGLGPALADGDRAVQVLNGSRVVVPLPGLSHANGSVATFAFWMRWAGDYNDHWAFVMSFPGSANLAMRDDSQCFGINTWNDDCYGISIDPTWQQSWTHVTVELTSNDVTRAKFYINGIFAAASQRRGPAGAWSFRQRVVLGYGENGQQFWFNGRFDEFVAYYRPIQSWEVAVLSSKSLASTGQWRVPENAAPGFTVGRLSLVDADVGDTATFSFADAPNPDNGLVSIVPTTGGGWALRINDAPNFELRWRYVLTLKAVDGQSNYVYRNFTVVVVNLVENAPSALMIQPASYTRPAYDQAVLSKNPVAYLRFEETQGPTIVDATGNGNNGTSLQAFYFLRRPSIAGSAIAFDGYSGRMSWDLPRPTSSSMTFSLWMKWNGQLAVGAVAATLLSVPCQSGDQLLMIFPAVPSGGMLGFSAYTQNAFGYDFRGVPGVQRNVWYHVVAEFYPNPLLNQLWINGWQAALVPSGPTPPSRPFLTTRQTVLVASGPMSNNSFGGELDELAVWYASLSAADIAELALSRVYHRIGLSTPVGADVALLRSVDADAYDQQAVSLVAGPGDDDNDDFTIAPPAPGGNYGVAALLRLARPINLSVKSEYRILVRSFDSDGLILDRNFTIYINASDLTPYPTTGSTGTAAGTTAAPLVAGCPTGTLGSHDCDVAQSIPMPGVYPFCNLGVPVDPVTIDDCAMASVLYFKSVQPVPAGTIVTVATCGVMAGDVDTAVAAYVGGDCDGRLAGCNDDAARCIWVDRGGERLEGTYTSNLIVRLDSTDHLVVAVGNPNGRSQFFGNFSVQFTASPGLDYLGCYRDDAPRDFEYLVGYQTGSQSICALRCHELGYMYFGVQRGEQCWCGNSYGRHGLADEDECNQPCREEPDQICGGDDVNSVYAVADGVGQLPVSTTTGQQVVNATGGITTGSANRCPAGVTGASHDCSAPQEIPMPGVFPVCNLDVPVDPVEMVQEACWLSATVYFRSLSTVPARTIVTVTTCGLMPSDANTVVAAHVGAACYQYLAGCNDDDTACGSSGASTVLFRMPEDNYVVVAIGGTEGDQFAGNFSVQFADPPPYVYVGCYADMESDSTPRDFEVRERDTGSQTFCAYLCHRRGYQYFALQYYGQCFCGNSYGRYGRATSCDLPCADEWDMMCGGSWANGVYAFVAPSATSSTPMTTGEQSLHCPAGSTAGSPACEAATAVTMPGSFAICTFGLAYDVFTISSGETCVIGSTLYYRSSAPVAEGTQVTVSTCGLLGDPSDDSVIVAYVGSGCDGPVAGCDDDNELCVGQLRSSTLIFTMPTTDVVTIAVGGYDAMQWVGNVSVQFEEANSAPVSIKECRTEANTQWFLNSSESSISVTSGPFAQLCLDVFACQDADGTPVIVHLCHPGDVNAPCGGLNQQWVRRPDGTIRSRLDGARCLDASATGPNVTIRSCNGGGEQVWSMEPDGTIRNAARCLTVGGPPAPAPSLTTGVAAAPTTVGFASPSVTTAALSSGGLSGGGVPGSECCSDSFVVEDAAGSPLFEVSAADRSCTCTGRSHLAGGVAVGSAGTRTASVRHLIVPLGASDPTSGTVGTVPYAVSWGVTYANATKLRPMATTRSTGVNNAVFALTFSQLSTTGAVLRVLRLDHLGGGWNDTSLAASVMVVEDM